MIIGCPDCSTKFGIPDGALGDVGRKVRCAKCGHVWLATNDDAISVEQSLIEVADDAITPPQAENVETATEQPVIEDDEVIDEDLPDEVLADDDHSSEEDIKGLSDRSVEEALAVIKGSSIEEPDFPLGKGEINEYAVIGSPKMLIIGWGALGVFLISVILVFFLMQDSLRQAWPPITKLYDVVGLLDSAHDRATDEEVIAEPIDYSQFIRISNDATYERLADGSSALVIRGAVTNTAEFDINLPSVEVILRNERRQDIHTWPFEFDEKTLKAGKTMPFVEAIQSPPEETTEFELMLLWPK